MVNKSLPSVVKRSRVPIYIYEYTKLKKILDKYVKRENLTNLEQNSNLINEN